jgi:hypothetical protein
MKTSENNIVKLTLDPNNPTPLTHKDRAELEAVAAMPDESIDYTDAPNLQDAAWVKVVGLPEK